MNGKIPPPPFSKVCPAALGFPGLVESERSEESKNDRVKKIRSVSEECDSQVGATGRTGVGQLNDARCM